MGLRIFKLIRIFLLKPIVNFKLLVLVAGAMLDESAANPRFQLEMVVTMSMLWCTRLVIQLGFGTNRTEWTETATSKFTGKISRNVSSIN